jgi:hypothetical protein
MSVKSLSIVAAAALALCGGAAQAAEQIANGGFETAGATTPAANWLPTGVPPGYTRQDTMVYEGSWAMLINGSQQGAFGAEQNSVKDGLMSTLPLAPDVTLTFWAKGTAGTTGDLKVRLAYLDDVGNIEYDSNFQSFSGGINPNSWTMSTLQGPAVPKAGLAAFVQFNLGMGTVSTTGCGLNQAEPCLPGMVYIDSVSVQAIPEPSTYALMALGLGGVVAFARRRRSA